MSYRLGDIFYEQFITTNSSGQVNNMDSLPVGIFDRNSLLDSSVNVFVTSLDVGRYVASGIIPLNYTLPSVATVVCSGSMNGIVQKLTMNLGQLDRPVSVTGVNYWTGVEMQQIRYKVGIDGQTAIPTVNIVGNLELSNSGLHAINVEPGVNMNQWLSLVGAFAAGSSTVNGNNINYYALNNNSTQRISATAISGARQAIILYI